MWLGRQKYFAPMELAASECRVTINMTLLWSSGRNALSQWRLICRLRPYSSDEVPASTFNSACCWNSAVLLRREAHYQSHHAAGQHDLKVVAADGEARR
jgi:hypothetical protein